ncbi:MAG: putative alpha/beta-fold hydrolase [Gammaproteobacteria bacterium]|jgi:predicted alpha/beta-fold hydrolase
MIRIDNFIIVLLLSFFISGQLAAADNQELSREQQIADKLAQVADVDEIISLKAMGGRFIGLYKSASSSESFGEISKTRETNGVVILVHGMGAHPDWPDVISPLRTQLTESGWSTFSIQMPILSPEEPVAKYGKTLKIANSRISAAIDYLHAWEMQPIILLGYSFGAAQAANYLASDKSKNVAAFVSVSMLSQKFIKPGLDVFKFISRINIPILDIYAEDDLDAVRRGIDDRRLAASKNSHVLFQQIEVQQAGHYYIGVEKALAEQIHMWLQQMTSVVGESREDYEN